MDYSENTWDEFGVEHIWKNVERLDALMTDRGTFVEMIYRPQWGIACYMDNAIQSCEIDEHIYHESLVHPVMASGKAERVMIIGGGEGATAREVLKWPVKRVDMFEWDKDIVELFKNKYPQWSKNAWDDDRLFVHYNDIFEMIHGKPKTPYDAIIIDLFDPDDSNLDKWRFLLQNLKNWVKPQGSIVIYAGIRNVLVHKQWTTVLKIMAHESMPHLKCIPYKVFIPSFSGESTFILLTSPDADQEFTVTTHITQPIWDSYKVFNY